MKNNFATFLEGFFGLTGSTLARELPFSGCIRMPEHQNDYAMAAFAAAGALIAQEGVDLGRIIDLRMQAFQALRRTGDETKVRLAITMQPILAAELEALPDDHPNKQALFDSLMHETVWTLMPRGEFEKASEVCGHRITAATEAGLEYAEWLARYYQHLADLKHAYMGRGNVEDAWKRFIDVSKTFVDGLLDTDKPIETDEAEHRAADVMIAVLAHNWLLELPPFAGAGQWMEWLEGSNPGLSNGTFVMWIETIKAVFGGLSLDERAARLREIVDVHEDAANVDALSFALAALAHTLHSRDGVGADEILPVLDRLRDLPQIGGVVFREEGKRIRADLED